MLIWLLGLLGLMTHKNDYYFVADFFSNVLFVGTFNTSELR